MRNTEWTRDFASLWWYTRCKNKDQGMLYLTLFASWSATSHGMMADVMRDESIAKEDGTNTLHQFAYPSKFFVGYSEARDNVRELSQQYLPLLQKLWTNWFHSERSGDLSSNEYSHPPQNDYNHDLDGGMFKHRGIFTQPMELPNVLILPVEAFDTKLSNLTVHWPALAEKATRRDAFLVHSKKWDDRCTNSKCWPFQ